MSDGTEVRLDQLSQFELIQMIQRLNVELATAHAIIKEQEQDIANITAREAAIKQNYETAALNQAAQVDALQAAVNEARKVIERCSAYIGSIDHGQNTKSYMMCDAWLAAHAPAQQEPIP